MMIFSFTFFFPQVSRASVEEQIASALRQIAQDADSDASHALIIDGKSLMYALEDGMKKQLLDLAVQCASVICCRVSPKQKAQVRLQPVSSLHFSARPSFYFPTQNAFKYLFC
jgi:hypothetical protein